MPRAESTPVEGWKETCEELLKMGDVVLVPGGIGYIGTHLTGILLDRGYRVRILDNFLDICGARRDWTPSSTSP